MKPPKEPKSFKWPRLYWTPWNKRGVAQMRIIYPDKRPPERTAWHPGIRELDEVFDYNGLLLPCCWHPSFYGDGSEWTPKRNLIELKTFCKFKKQECIFIGEIK